METCFEGIAIILGLAIGPPLVLIFIGLVLHVIHIAWLVFDELEKFIVEKINKQIYDKQKRLRKELDGD